MVVVKKKLAIEESEAEVVREIFELYVYGRNNSPRIGIKQIANTLNGQGKLMRGKPWRIQKIHAVLSSLTYVGWHVFNKTDSKSHKTKDASEWVKVPVPAIIDQGLFDKATKLRSAYTPLRSAPRRESSPTLLTGILKCECGCTMVLQTGKSNQYRYYKCSSRISKGIKACKSASYPVDKLENLVLEAVKNKILHRRPYPHRGGHPPPRSQAAWRGRQT